MGTYRADGITPLSEPYTPHTQDRSLLLIEVCMPFPVVTPS